jgi:DNA-binding MarR family transcriptional regulator
VEQAARDSPTTGYFMWRVVLKWRAAVDRGVAPLGLTHAQYSLLAALYGQSRTGVRPSQRELADFTGLEPMYISKLARALEDAGWIERDPHPEDPRAVQLRITPQGLKTVTRAIRVVGELEDQMLAPLGGASSQASAELRAMLHTLLAD